MPRPKVNKEVREYTNVTGAEVLRIIVHDTFVAPPRVDVDKFTRAVELIRDAIRKIGRDFDFPLGKSEKGCPHIYHQVCCPIDRIVENRTDIDYLLLRDPVIKKARREIQARLIIRIRLATHPQINNLLACADKKGKIDKFTLSKSGGKDNKKIGKIFGCIYDIMNEFFNQNVERKRLAWTLVAELLSQIAGRKIEFINLNFGNPHAANDHDDENVKNVAPEKKVEPVKNMAVQIITVDDLKRAELTGNQRFYIVVTSENINLLRKNRFFRGIRGEKIGRKIPISVELYGNRLRIYFDDEEGDCEPIIIQNDADAVKMNIFREQ